MAHILFNEPCNIPFFNEMLSFFQFTEEFGAEIKQNNPFEKREEREEYPHQLFFLQSPCFISLSRKERADN